jgi:hypothetical protein
MVFKTAKNSQLIVQSIIWRHFTKFIGYYKAEF